MKNEHLNLEFVFLSRTLSLSHTHTEENPAKQTVKSSAYALKPHDIVHNFRVAYFAGDKKHLRANRAKLFY